MANAGLVPSYNRINLNHFRDALYSEAGVHPLISCKRRKYLFSLSLCVSKSLDVVECSEDIRTQAAATSGCGKYVKWLPYTQKIDGNVAE